MSVDLFAFVYIIKHLQIELWWFSGQRRMQLGQDEKRSTKTKGMRTWDGRLQTWRVGVECRTNYASILLPDKLQANKLSDCNRHTRDTGRKQALFTFPRRWDATFTFSNDSLVLAWMGIFTSSYLQMVIACSFTLENLSPAFTAKRESLVQSPLNTAI